MKTLSLLMQAFLMLISFALLTVIGAGDYDSFLVWCRYGTFVVVLSVALYSVVVGSALTSMTLVMASFIVFQFGVPMLYGFVDGYSNYYARFLSGRELATGAAYTVFCIQAFILGATMAHGGDRGLRSTFGSLGNKPYLSDSRNIVRIAGIVFVLTGLIAIPRALLFFQTSLAYGISAARDAYETGGIVNICRGLFVPFGLVLLVYMEKCPARSVALSVLWLYAVLSAFSGDRTEGLTLMAALIFSAIAHKPPSGKVRTKVAKAALALIAAVILVWLLVAIANMRVGGSAVELSLGDAVVSALEEMGFNALTVSFQMQVFDGLRYGLTYLTSITALIPTSLDFAGIKEAVLVVDPTTQYYAAMSSNYGWSTFGLGYSIVAESYLNFGFFGWLVMPLIGMIVERLLGSSDESYFGRYLSLVFLWSFLTLPRRQMTWLVNAFEYDLLFVLIILWIWHSLVGVRSRSVPASRRSESTAIHYGGKLDA